MDEPPSGVRLSISLCPIQLISPLHPCPVPTAPPVETVQGEGEGGSIRRILLEIPAFDVLCTVYAGCGKGAPR